MRKRFTTVVVMTSAALALCVGIANAVVQTNGNGQTHLSASLGFNAKADLRGELNYNSDDGTFAAHCSGYTRYSEAITAQGFPRTRVQAICLDKNTGGVVYLKAYFIDKGEPGLNDVARIYWSYTQKQAELDPFIVDSGKISSGNIQIHYGGSLDEGTADMVSADATA
jgi:hypothetical protein